LSSQQFFKDLTNINIRREIYTKREEATDAEAPPALLFDDGLEEESFQEKDGTRWYVTDEMEFINDFWDITKDPKYGRGF
jgi:hypothetical protein